MNGTAQEVERETPVIFTWADREGSSWWLAVFIFLSFLAHSSAFFLFQGKNPVPPRTVRTAPVVQILSSAGDAASRNSETEALLQWIATHDPALVAKVQPDTPASRADLRGGTRVEDADGVQVTLGGDVIVRIGKTPIASAQDVSRAVALHVAGEKVQFTVLRGGKTRRVVEVTLAERPS